MSDFPKTYAKGSLVRVANNRRQEVQFTFDGYKPVAQTEKASTAAEPSRSSVEAHRRKIADENVAAEAASEDEDTDSEDSGVDSWETDGGPTLEKAKPKPQPPKTRK
jgi:Tfp pilus assembly protein PilV